MSFRKTIIILLLLPLLLVLTGCGAEDNPENQQEEEQMPDEITDLETGLIRIMQQADVIPLVPAAAEERYIAGNEEEQDNEEVSDQQESPLPEEPTFEDTILGELLKREGEAEGVDEEQELPENKEAAWDNIKNTITELYDLWDELEPRLREEKITEGAINNFEEGLDSLTIYSTEENHFDTMVAANQMTGHLAKFMVPFVEDIESLTSELRFHIRKTVLQVAQDNYNGAQESLDYLKEHRPDLAKALNEEQFSEMETSMDNLQRALDKQNLDLVILNAAVLMENMVQVVEIDAA